jgi:glutamate dehydrogenase (NAD(P)+)
VNTNRQIMAWMMDTYSMNVGATATGVVTGKPIHLGGSARPRQGHRPRRVRHTAAKRAAASTSTCNGAKVAIRASGNVGSSAPSSSRRRLQDRRRAGPHGTIYNGSGSTGELIPHVKANRRRRGFKGAETMGNEEFWGRQCDILIPAALEGQITPTRAPHQRRLVLEGANGPTVPSADDILPTAASWWCPT